MQASEYPNPSNVSGGASSAPYCTPTAPNQVEVIIPPDVSPGDMMSAVDENDKLYQFVVPRGVVAGQGVMMQIPTAPPPEYDRATAAPIQEQILNDMYPVEEEIPIVEVIPCPVVEKIQPPPAPEPEGCCIIC